MNAIDRKKENLDNSTVNTSEASLTKVYAFSPHSQKTYNIQTKYTNCIQQIHAKTLHSNTSSACTVTVATYQRISHINKVIQATTPTIYTYHLHLPSTPLTKEQRHRYMTLHTFPLALICQPSSQFWMCEAILGKWYCCQMHGKIVWK